MLNPFLSRTYAEGALSPWSQDAYVGNSSEGINARQYITPRDNLVQSILQLVNQHGTVLIKAPPQVRRPSSSYDRSLLSIHQRLNCFHFSFQDRQNRAIAVVAQTGLIYAPCFRES